MKGFCITALAAVTLTGCMSANFVNPYDPVIDQGLKDYKESVNAFAKDVSDQAGTTEGTYQANKSRYNLLEAKIEVLIDRAEIKGNGKGCKLAVKTTERLLDKFADKLPVELQTAAQSGKGDEAGCTERMLVLVQKQLQQMEQIHSSIDRCRNDDNQMISCLRATTSKVAMATTNQAINAAWVVETAKQSRD